MTELDATRARATDMIARLSWCVTWRTCKCFACYQLCCDYSTFRSGLHEFRERTTPAKPVDNPQQTALIRFRAFLSSLGKSLSPHFMGVGFKGTSLTFGPCYDFIHPLNLLHHYWSLYSFIIIALLITISPRSATADWSIKFAPRHWKAHGAVFVVDFKFNVFKISLNVQSTSPSSAVNVCDVVVQQIMDARIH